MTTQTPRIVLEDLPEQEILATAEMNCIIGAGPERRAWLGLKRLETREVMASSLTASVSGGILRIDGTERADNTQIVLSNDQISLAGIQISQPGKHIASVPITSINQIQVKAPGGDELVQLDKGNQPVTRPATFLGFHSGGLHHGAATVTQIPRFAQTFANTT